jgi:hypothetical protein
LLELVGCGAVIKPCCELAYMQCPPFRSKSRCFEPFQNIIHT